MMMQVTETKHSSYTTLSPSGELDANSSIHMDEKIRSCIDAGQVCLHIDCSRLTYISSAGLGVFISFLEELKQAKGNLVFSGMNPRIRSVFELLGLHQLITIAETEAEATKIFTP
jgi:anti-sigma B factor antagonist